MRRAPVTSLAMRAAFAAAAVTPLVPLAAHADPGWYVGVEGGVSWQHAQEFNVYNYNVPLSDVPDGTRIGRAQLHPGWLGGLSFGYAFSNGLRSELELSYRRNEFKSLYRDDLGLLSSAGNTKDVDGNENLATAMANVWYDLLPNKRYHPYLGGGIGVARMAINDARWDNTELRDRYDTALAWQFGGGIAYDISPHWTASADYRYIKLSGGSSFDLLENQPDTHVEAGYQAQSAMLTLRYSFGAPTPPPVPPAPEPEPQVVPVVAPPPPPPPPKCEQPQPGQALSLDGCKVGDKLVLNGVNFDFDKARLTLNAKTLLDQVAAELKRHADIEVEVDGHTDSKGSDAYNMKLSEQRAKAVKAYLVDQGIDASRMTTRGYGETMPIADNGTDEGREKNRRVELKITAGGAGSGGDGGTSADAGGDPVAPPLTLSDGPRPPLAPADPLAEPATH
ncbi:OmpA family protein [Solimonas marina]|uniref:OmpA family protein n=1 Tax=Solimonas marina TaxID=2714601 RepID=A0A969W6G4_9GAMM|nr:OmpA family protein [Solimonas marina]NKF20818.1 OmpA family protein [Solimonas marina]